MLSFILASLIFISSPASATVCATASMRSSSAILSLRLEYAVDAGKQHRPQCHNHRNRRQRPRGIADAVECQDLHAYRFRKREFRKWLSNWYHPSPVHHKCGRYKPCDISRATSPGYLDESFPRPEGQGLFRAYLTHPGSNPFSIRGWHMVHLVIRGVNTSLYSYVGILKGHATIQYRQPTHRDAS